MNIDTGDDKNKIAVNYAKYKFFKWVLRTIAGIVFSSTFLIFLLILILIVTVTTRLQGFSTSSDYTRFSQMVEQYRTMIEDECERQEIGYYSDVVLAIMQCSTGGTTYDPMNSSSTEFNTRYGKNRGDIQNVSYSIKCGVSEIKELIKLCDVEDLYDTAALSIMYQSYEFDRDYIEYATQNGGYSSDNAKEYINRDDKNNLKGRNVNFAINVSMYMQLITGGLKPFIYPLAIHEVLNDYSEENQYMYLGGVFRQVVLSSCEGNVISLEKHEDYSNIEIEYEDFVLRYEYITNVTVEAGDAVAQGETLGMVMYLEDFENYGIKFSMYENDTAVNPNEYLDKLSIERAELDEKSIATGEAIADYAKMCIDKLKYKKGGSNAFGCDEIGFIHNVFSNFMNYNDNYFDITTESFEELINCIYVTYHNDVKEHIQPQIMYEGDIIVYEDENGYITAGIYVGESRVVHMTESGVVQDFYNFATPACLVRVLGQNINGMTWPLPGYGRDCITSPFNPNRVHPITGVVQAHTGTDIAAPMGTDVVAADAGEVIESSYNESAGFHVVISHENGIKTYYYHACVLMVSKGDYVEKGQEIMLVGSSGMSTGPHLHFGISIDEEWINPMDYTYLNE